MNTKAATYRLLMTVPVLSFFLNCQSCVGKNTPEKYLNTTTVSQQRMTKDSVKLVSIVSNIIRSKKIWLYKSEAFDSTSIIHIDTILYNPDFDKLAFFVIVRQSSNFMPEKGLSYDANCFIADIINGEIHNVRWLKDYNVSGYRIIKKASERIRELHFHEFYREGSDRYIYNLNDIRFWTNRSIWNN